MRITVVENYEDLSSKASEVLFQEVKENPRTQCCLATGSSPTGMYANFISKVKASNLDISNVLWTKLDEWVGISLSNPSSCESYIKEHILEPLNISDSKYLSLNSEVANLAEECKRIAKSLKDNPLDVCILGIGVNGHLGLNEPDEKLYPFTHVVNLDPLSKQHPMLSSQKVTQGVSLGMSEILQAKKIIFLVSGNSKKEAFKKFMNQELSTKNPSSFLWLHSNVELIVEKELYDSI